MTNARSVALAAAVVSLVAPSGAASADPDGARNGYSQVRVTANGLNAPDGGEAVLLGGRLYYGGYGFGADSAGAELWRTSLDEDGNGVTTELVADIDPGGRSSNPVNLTPVGSDLYFAATDRARGKELWRYDDATGETDRLTDLDDAAVIHDPSNPNPPEPDGSSAPEDLTPFGDGLYFTADHGAEQRNLYLLDRGSDEVTMVGSDATGPRDPRDLTVIDGQLYYSASGVGYSRQLWRTDPSTGATEVVSEVWPTRMIAVGPYLYFFQDDSVHNDELWRYDTSTERAELVHDLTPGPSPAASPTLTRAGHFVYFSGYDGTHGSELWRSDSDTGVTEMVDDIRPGSKGSSPFWITPAKHFVYFNADDGRTGAELWRTSVRTGRTTQVADLNPGRGRSFPLDMSAVDGTVYFSASRTGSVPDRLWATDARTGDTVVALSGKQGNKAGTVQDIGGALYYFGDLAIHRLIPPAG